MSVAHSPFFDTRLAGTLDLAANLTRYPHDYCRFEDNRQAVARTVPASPAIKRAAGILAGLQEQLATSLALGNVDEVWSRRGEWAKLPVIATSAAAPALSSPRLSEAHKVLQLRLLEGVVDNVPWTGKGATPAAALHVAAQCVWLSDHLAMVVLGIAVVHIDPVDGRLVFEPSSVHMRKHLRRMWFGVALETQSLQAANARLEAAVHLASSADATIAQREQAFYEALSIFPQHWRLPVNGIVSSLLEDYLIPLLRITIHVMSAHVNGHPEPYRLENARRLGAAHVFDVIRRMQASLPPTDRLFDVIDGGLVLGSRTPAAGLIAIAEIFANMTFGDDWHGKVSKEQKAYVLERLGRTAAISVLDFELLQRHTTNNERLDVDFFVRDTLHHQIYAVQLKHFQFSDKAGLLYWISLFRPRGKGTKAIVQLDGLRRLIDTDPKVRATLEEIGIAPSEFGQIVPVILHNIGPLDFWELQEGVLFFDTGTFCNVLDGRSGSFLQVRDGVLSSGALASHSSPQPSLHDPEAVIAAYVSDPRFASLASFDAAAGLVRSTIVDGVRIEAIGLGI